MTRAGSKRASAARHSNDDAGMRLPSSILWGIWSVIGWSACLAGVGWGLTVLERQVAAQWPEVPCHVQLAELPAWLVTDDYVSVRQAVEQSAGVYANTRLDDPELCARVAQGLSASPWVARVNRVSKRPDGTIECRAEYRQPFAYVDVHGWAYLIDAAGYRLPPECGTDFLRGKSWYVIAGVSAPVPPLGALWVPAPDRDAATAGTEPKIAPDLGAGLRLVELLKRAEAQQQLPFRSLLWAVDVANFQRRENRFDGSLRIRTVYPRAYVNWGEPPGEEFTVEATADRKLAMLNALYAQEGQLRNETLDVRDPRGIRH